MDKLHTKAFIEKQEGKMVAVASEEVEDRQGEILSIDGWDLKNFKKNPVLLWYHNLRERSLPIGKAENIRYKIIDNKKKLTFEPIFEEITEFGRTIKKFFEESLLNTFSVGFIPLEKDGNKYIKQELLEISAVPVPALPSAQVVSRAQELGIDKKITEAILGNEKALSEIISDGKNELGSKELGDEIENKKVIPFVSYDLAPESRSWDEGATISRLKKWAVNEKNELDFSKYKKAFTWVGENDKELTAYKLVHHDIQGVNLITVWRGVANSMALLLGANSVIIPEEDRKAVYNHLKKHYEEFNKIIPDFRLVENQVLKGLDEEINALVENYELTKVYKLLTKIKNEQKKQVIAREVKTPVKIDGESLLKVFAMVYQKIKNYKSDTKGGE